MAYLPVHRNVCMDPEIILDKLNLKQNFKTILFCKLYKRT